MFHEVGRTYYESVFVLSLARNGKMMKTRLLIIAFLTVALCFYSCEKTSSDDQNNKGSGDEIENLPSLPKLDDVDDVCTKMLDLNFMKYCYDNFDVNNDAKVSMSEANAVKSISCSDVEDFAGIEYFSNLESIVSYSAKHLDLRYNTQLTNIICSEYGSKYSNFHKGAPIEQLDLRYCTNLTNIEEHAFNSCEFLSSVKLPSGLIEIGHGSFMRCTSLTSIEIPSSLLNIENFAFEYCGSLTSINLPSCLERIGLATFDDCTSLVLDTLPSCLTEMDADAFSRCISITSIEIPSGITEIKAATFAESGLESIILPSGIVSIRNRAFYECESLKTVTSKAITPPGLDDEGFSDGSPFYDCPSLTTLYVPSESVEAYKDSDWADYFTEILPL